MNTDSSPSQVPDIENDSSSTTFSLYEGKRDISPVVPGAKTLLVVLVIIVVVSLGVHYLRR